MAFFEHVERGAAYRPRADLENAICDLLNRRNGFVEHSMRGNDPSQLRIAVYNAGASMILYGAPVEINADATSVEGILPVKSATETATTWGIALTTMDCGESGDMLAVGVTQIRGITGTAKEFVVPDGGGGFVYSDGGICRVLRALDESSAMVLLGLSTAQDDDTFFKLSHRVELIESGGVQVETRFVDITNPGQVYAFGSTFAPPLGTVAVESGDMVYVEFGYFCDSGGEVRYTTTPIESGGILHPHMRLGSVTDSSVIQEYVSKESLLRLHQVFDGGTYIARPIISGGQAMLEIPGRVTDLGECPAATIAELGALGCNLYCSGRYDSGYTVNFVTTSSSITSAAVFVGTIGIDLVDSGSVIFKDKFVCDSE